MELAQILRSLWDRRTWVAVVCLFAVAVAILAGFRVSLVPPGLERRSLELGTATTQILIDSPRSSLLDVKQDTPPLAVRAAVYAQFLRTNAVKESIAQTTGIPTRQIEAEGPFTTLSGRQNITRPSEARADEVSAEGDRYRLVFDAQPDLPIVSVFAQAPTQREATMLANGVVTGLRSYVDRLQGDQRLPIEARVVIRELGPAEGGVVNSGTSPLIMLLAFVVVLMAGCLVILVVSGVARSWRRLAAAEEEAALEVDAPAAANGWRNGRAEPPDHLEERATDPMPYGWSNGLAEPPDRAEEPATDTAANGWSNGLAEPPEHVEEPAADTAPPTAEASSRRIGKRRRGLLRN